VEVTPEDVEVTKPAKRSRGVQNDIREISTLVIYFCSPLATSFLASNPFPAHRAGKC
jgi:hypothetical protein